MSWQATTWVIEHSRHKGSALLTLLCIANCANDDGTDCWPSIPRLAKDTRLSERQVKRIIETLEKSGELEVQRGTGRSNVNHYQFPRMKKGDKLSVSQNERVTSGVKKGDISDLKGDISSTKGDISSTKGDIAMSPEQSIEQSVKEQSVEPSMPFVSPEFHDALKAYDRTAKQRKVKESPEQRRALFKKLLAWGELRATQALEDTVANGWRGVFEPRMNGKENKNGSSNSGPGGYQTAAERRADSFRGMLSVVEELRGESGGTVNENVRRKSS